MRRWIAFLVTAHWVLHSFCYAEEQGVGEVFSFLRHEWNLFRSAEPSLAHYTSAQIAQLGNRWEQAIVSSFSLSEEMRKIDPQVIEKLQILIQENQPKIFILAEDLENSELKKSAAEWFGQLIVWKYLQEKTGNCFCIQSSESKHVLEAATILAEVLGTCAQPVAEWNVPPYISPKEVHPSEKENENVKLSEENALDQKMQEELHRSLCTHTAFIAMTYSQQLDAIQKHTRTSPTEFDAFGLIVVTSDHVESFPSGIFLHGGSEMQKEEKEAHPMNTL